MLPAEPIVIATSATLDIQWDDDIEEAWRTVLGFVIKRMLNKY